jgi:hypothetical protein
MNIVPERRKRHMSAEALFKSEDADFRRDLDIEERSKAKRDTPSDVDDDVI